jgi:hypothetical protein
MPEVSYGWAVNGAVRVVRVIPVIARECVSYVRWHWFGTSPCSMKWRRIAGKSYRWPASASATAHAVSQSSSKAIQSET